MPDTSGTTDGLRIEPIDRTRWIEAAAGFADHSYRHTWDFGVASAARVRAVSEHVAILDGSRTVALADVRVRKLPLVGGGIAYVTGGPLTRRGGEFDSEVFSAAVRALRDEYGSRRGLVLRILPPIGPEAWNREMLAALGTAGFVATTASPGYRTMLLPVDRPAADIRKSMHQKWRNCLNRSERENLTVTAARDVASLEWFGGIFEEFVVRKGFGVPLGVDFYARVQRELPESERFVVLRAEADGVAIAGHVSSVVGDTLVYLLGATSPEALTKKAAYLLQWKAIELARERGCRWYDLGGIDPEGNPGVHHFKEGLGGADVTAAGPLEWGSGIRSRLTLALEARVRARLAARRARPAKA